MARLRRAAAVMVVTVSMIRGTSAAAEPLDEAKEHFKVGVAYLQDPDGARYEEAYAQFKKAYELSKSPKVLGNLALCAMKLERDGEAIEGYTRYLAEVDDIGELERAQVALDLQTLQASAARVSVTVEVRGGGAAAGPITVHDTRQPARGSPVVNIYPAESKQLELVVRPGHHSLIVQAGGRAAPTWDFEASPGARLSHSFVVDDVPPPAPQPERHRVPQAPAAAPAVRTGPLVVIGVGAAALVAGGIVGLVTLGKIGDLEQACPGDVCPADAYDEVESVRGWVRATDLLLLGGAAVSAVGVGWFLLSAPGEQPAGPRASIRAAAGCAGSTCRAALRIGF